MTPQVSWRSGRQVMRRLAQRVTASPAGRGGLSFVIANVAVNVSNFLFHVVVSRQLGPSEYGSLGALLNLTAVVAVLLGAVQATVTQSVAEHGPGPLPIRRLVRLATLGAGGVVLLWVVATPTIDRFLHLRSPTATIILGLWLVPALLGGVLEGVYIGRQQFRPVALSQVAGGVVVRIVLGPVLVALGLGVAGAVAATVLASVTTALILLWPLRHEFRTKAKFAPGGSNALLTVVALGGATLLTSLDAWLARHFLPGASSGYFVAAATAGRIALFLPGAVTVLYFPRIAATRGAGAEARQAFGRCLAAVSALGMTAAAVMWLLPGVVIGLLFGSQFSESSHILGIVGTADACIGIASCLVYYQVARRSRLAHAAWPACGLAVVLAALFHGSITSLAYDMLGATVPLVLFLLIPSLQAVLRSLAEEHSSLERVVHLLDEPEVDLTLVVPYRNVGAQRLRRHVGQICDVLDDSGATYEVVPVSDGSTDGSEAALLETRPDVVRPIVFAENRGKGEALRIGLSAGHGRYLGFIDGDGDIPAGVLTAFVALANETRPDVVVGSKRHPESDVSYPWVRLVYSVGYQLLTRMLFHIRVRDTQTGVKFVRRDVLAEVLPRMVEKRFAFDLELLAVAHRLGYRKTAELPVSIAERFPSTISPTAVWRMLQDTLATFYRLRVLGFYDPPLTPAEPAPAPCRLDGGGHLRILVCNWRDLAHPRAGGAEVYTHEVASAWAAQGHHVTIFAAAVAGQPSYEVRDGVHIIRRGGRHTVYRQARQYFERQGRGHFDLVIDEVNTRPFGAARWAGDTPVVAVIHQVAKEIWFHEVTWPVALLGRFWLEPRWLRHLRDVPALTVSESSSRSLRSYGLRNIQVVSQGHTPAPVPDVAREHVPTVVFVGRLSSNKRPDDAVEAFTEVRRVLPDAQLWVLGSGPMEEELRRKAPAGVQFLGRVGEEEKVERLARAHALVATSVREGWGLTVSEAAAVGTPAVTYDVAGLRDSVAACGGVLVKPRPQALAAALIERLPEWTSGQMPAVEVGGVQSWPQVAANILVASEAGLADAAALRRRQTEEDLSVAWRRMLGPISGIADRRYWSLAGISLVLASALTRQAAVSGWPGRLGGFAFVCFAIAAVGAIADVIWRGRSAELPPTLQPEASPAEEAEAEKAEAGEPAAPGPGDQSRARHGQRLARRIWAPGIVVVACASAAQTWFAGGPPARGDVVPPGGTAWLGHLFDASRWTSHSPGTLQASPLALPWALVLGIVHATGGSPALADRLWTTLLFCGVGVGGFCLLAALRLRPAACAVGALVYAFNPYTVSQAGFDPVSLAAMSIVPLLFAWSITSGRSRLWWRWLAALVPAALVVGFVATEPSLVLVCAAALAAGPVAAGWLFGRGQFFRTLRRTAAGLAVLAVGSLYWIVPLAINARSSMGAGQSASAWTALQGRSTLANALWLNTAWNWNLHTYFPYAHYYAQFPLAFLKYLLPIAALAALAVVAMAPRSSRTDEHRIAAGAAVVALGIVFLSTGTNFPGYLLFNPLSALPYGWLLDSPGQFLFLTGLAYGTLIAVAVDITVTQEHRAGVASPSFRWGRVAPALAGVGLLVAAAYPLYSGAVVSAARDGYPSDHVTMPRYWTSMAGDVGRLAQPGSVLVLPEDDYYQMPYTWYYGSDTFLSQLLARPVVDPVGQGSSPAPTHLRASVGVIQTAILDRNWVRVDTVARAAGARYVLVRGDIESALPGRAIQDPGVLASAFRADIQTRLVAQRGPLDLFELPSASQPAAPGRTEPAHSGILRRLDVVSNWLDCALAIVALFVGIVPSPGGRRRPTPHSRTIEHSPGALGMAATQTRRQPRLHLLRPPARSLS